MRTARQREDGVIYHIYNQINEKQLLLEPDTIKELFIIVIYEAINKKKFQFKLLNLTIMGNHYHMLLWIKYKEGISKIMHWIGCVFAMRYNKMTGRCGRLWMDRFKSIIVRVKEQLKRVFAYICNNPVKAGLCRIMTEYKYNYFGLQRHHLIKKIIEPISGWL